MNVAKLKRNRRIASVTAPTFAELPNLPDVSKFLIGIFMDSYIEAVIDLIYSPALAIDRYFHQVLGI